MARKSTLDKVEEIMDLIIVSTLSGDAYMVLHKIVRRLVREQACAFKFGDVIMHLNAVAMACGIEHRLLEAVMPQLEAAHLIATAADGTIGCPPLAQKQARSEINRNNALKRGKGKQRVPEQREMLGVVVGGKGDSVTENQQQNGAETSPTTTYLSKGKSIEVSSQVFQETAAKVLEAMRVDPARSYLDCGLVRQWLADGATPEVILDVVTRKAGPHVKTLKYFSAAIAEAIAAAPVATPQWKVKFNSDFSIWDLTGRQGPSPRLEDYRSAAA